MSAPRLAANHMKLTPEQNEEWREAINPLDYLDFYALSKSELLESEWRLREWGVPGWAAHLRVLLLSQDAERVESWHPGFALRSETALIGIQMFHEWEEYWDLEPLYARIFVRFAQEAIRPFVEYSSGGDEIRLKAYRPISVLLDSLSQVPIASERLSQLAYDDEEDFESDEAQHSRELAQCLSDMALGLVKSTAWNTTYSQPLQDIVAALNRQHRWRLNGDNGADYTNFIVDAYLIALEAECPPPDWLPLA